MHGDGARIDLIDEPPGLLRGAYSSGPLQPDDSVWPDDPDETLDQGVSGSGRRHRPSVAGPATMRRTTASPTGPVPTPTSAAAGIHSVMAVPLVEERGVVRGADRVHVRGGRLDGRGRDPPRSDRRAGRHRHHPGSPDRRSWIGRASASPDARRRNRPCARSRRVSPALRDPAEILQEVVELASRLVGGTGRHPGPARPVDRQPALGLRRRIEPPVHARRARQALDLGRHRRHRGGRRGRPGGHRGQRPRGAVPALARNRRSSTGGPGSTR